MAVSTRVNLYLFLDQINTTKDNQYTKCIDFFAKTANLIHIQILVMGNLKN